MSSRSATVLVIFVIAIVAFCLASVFGSMTGPITIFPNATDDANNLINSSYTEYNSYGSEYNDNYQSYEDSSNTEESNNDKSSEDSSSGGLLDSLTGKSDSEPSNVETTSDSSASNVETTSDSSASNVETTTDSSSKPSGDDTA